MSSYWNVRDEKQQHLETKEHCDRHWKALGLQLSGTDLRLPSQLSLILVLNDMMRKNYKARCLSLVIFGDMYSGCPCSLFVSIDVVWVFNHWRNYKTPIQQPLFLPLSGILCQVETWFGNTGAWDSQVLAFYGWQVCFLECFSSGSHPGKRKDQKHGLEVATSPSVIYGLPFLDLGHFFCLIPCDTSLMEF